MFKQRYRKACLAAIKDLYKDDTPGLMSDRIGGCYYSVWHVGDNLLEVTTDHGLRTIRIYEYQPINNCMIELNYQPINNF